MLVSITTIEDNAISNIKAFLSNVLPVESSCENILVLKNSNQWTVSCQTKWPLLINNNQQSWHTFILSVVIYGIIMGNEWKCLVLAIFSCELKNNVSIVLEASVHIL